jgi:hypothetical protein
MPTELLDDDGEKLRELGAEFGTTTVASVVAGGSTDWWSRAAAGATRSPTSS